MRTLTALRDQLASFCANTNLHGFVYVVQPKRARIERIFWAVSIVVSFVLTGSLIRKVIEENQRNPTIIYTDQNVVHVTDILFPSITIAPGVVLKTPLQTGVDYEKVKSQLERNEVSLENFTLSQLKRLQIASLVARDGLLARYNVTIPTDDLVQRMRSDFPTPWKIQKSSRLRNLVDGFYANYSWSHGVNFTEVLCPTGFCYTFNFPSDSNGIFRTERLSSDFNYTNFLRLAYYGAKHHDIVKHLEVPVKGSRNGIGLLFEFNANYVHIDDSYFSMDFYDIVEKMEVYRKMRLQYDIFEHVVPARVYYGLPLIFHGPYEVISRCDAKYYSLLQYNAKVLVTPKVFKYHQTVANMDITERQCYLYGEKNLKFFNVYNRMNCEHECLSNLTLDACGCTQFFMVREPNTRICGVSDERCFREVEKSFNAAKNGCMCHEMCARVEYDTQMQTNRMYKNKFNKLEDSTFIINFGVDKVLPTNRRKQHTVVGALTLIGIFVGLFAGFSVISAFELVYYFILQPMMKVSVIKGKSNMPPSKGTRRWKTLRSMKVSLRNFFRNSSIHCFKHIGNEGKSTCERLVWLQLFILAMAGSYLMVMQVYKSLQLNQIMMTMEGRTTRVQDIPFPAITFTNQIFMFSQRVENYIILSGAKLGKTRVQLPARIMASERRFGNATINTLFHQVYLTICHDVSAKEYLDRFTFNFSNSSQFVDFMRTNVSSEGSWKLMQNSTWNSAVEPPFAETINKRGFGQTFNLVEAEKLLNFEKISSDFRYNYTLEAAATFPWSTSMNEFKGLQVEILKLKHDKSCNDNRFSVHSPYELSLNDIYKVYRFEKALDVLITPEIVKADDDLRTVSVDKRHCYFEGERLLKFYKIYTKKNCEMECLSHVAYASCGCVPFYYVRNETMRVCDLRSYNRCLKPYDEALSLVDYEHLYQTAGVCKCYEECNHVMYKIEINEKFQRLDEFKKHEEERTKLTFRYKDSEYFALLRYQPFKLVDFLSYVGGILGLFAGISVLSIVEIFYFFTIKLFSDLLMRF